MRPWPRLYASGPWSGSGVSPAALARPGAMRLDLPPAHEPFPQTVGDYCAFPELPGVMETLSSPHRVISRCVIA